MVAMIEKRRERQNTINTLTVGFSGGVIAGFILSLALGAFNVDEMADVPDWLQGVASITATLVSVYAVYLVAQTLHATREALNETREMRKIADEQVRAWVLIHKHEIFPGPQAGRIEFVLKNYGKSPALSISISGAIINYDHIRVQGGAKALLPCSRAADTKQMSVMASESETVMNLSFDIKSAAEAPLTEVEFNIGYILVPSGKIEKMKITFLLRHIKYGYNKGNFTLEMR